MPNLRFVAAAVWFCSWACAGGEGAEGSDSSGAPPSARSVQPGTGSPVTAQRADEPSPEVLGGEQAPTTEGSNTNWRPIEPWLDGMRRPPPRERPDPRKPSGGQEGNSTRDPDQPSSVPEQQDGSSSSGAGSGSSNSTPSPD